MTRRYLARGAAATMIAGIAACADSTTAPRPPLSAAKALVAGMADCDASVLGPLVFTRTAGAPTVSGATFAALPGGFYSLEANDMGSRGANAELRLNGALVLASEAVAGSNRSSVAVPVTLAATNYLEVRLTGRPGSRVEVRIADTRVAAEVHVTPTARFLETGASRTYAAEVVDAEGQSIARCVTWSVADLTIATVDADGTVHGIAAGTTELIARADGVEARIPISVVQRAGATQTATFSGLCVVLPTNAGMPRACFDAVLLTTPLARGQTLVELSLRNRQGSSGAESLPGSAIRFVSILGPTSNGPAPVLAEGWSATTNGGVTTVGEPSVSVGTAGVFYPPHPGGPHFDGTGVGATAVLGCATYGARTPPSYWQTCGDAAGTVDVTFIAAGTWAAPDLFLYVSFDAAPETFADGSLDCTTRAGLGRFCQPRLPAGAIEAAR